jgi:uncharacterized protein
MNEDLEKLKVRCPICRQFAKWKDNKFRPFCSDECKKRDLGEWATERYRIPAGAGRTGGDESGEPGSTEE